MVWYIVLYIVNGITCLPSQSNAGKMCRILKDASIEQNHKPGLFHCGFCGAHSDSFKILSHESESVRGKSSLIENGLGGSKKKVTSSCPNWTISGFLSCMHIQHMVYECIGSFLSSDLVRLNWVVNCAYCILKKCCRMNNSCLSVSNHRIFI